jgi:glycine betaine/proline transport system substrate-binding protein
MLSSGMKRRLGVAACLAALAFAAGCGSDDSSTGESTESAASEPITFAFNSFSDARASTALATEVLKQAGYEVSAQMLGSVGLDFAAVSNGEADVFADAWLPYTHEEYWQRYGGELEKVSKLYDQPVNTGLAVPEYCPTQSVDQLNSQASTYDGKIIGIEAGSGLMSSTKELVGSYGLNLTLVPGSEAAMLATLKKAVSQDECVVVTLWRPHAAFALYPIRYLEEPKGVYKAEDAWTVTKPDFKEKFPGPYAFLEQFTIPLSDQEGMISKIVNDGQEPAAAAQAWMKANPGKVDAWLKLAKGSG